MNVIGLTGGIGMGKSTAAQLLAQRGLPVVDTDQLARQVVEPGQAALAEIQQTFGNDILGADGCLRRDELACRVFADEAARKKLEAITHPRIREAWCERVATWRSEGQARCVVVIPLLFETHAESQFNTILCVACSSATQHERLRRRGWSAGQIEQRIAAQWPIDKKATHAHFVVWNESSLDVCAEQLDRILKSIS